MDPMAQAKRRSSKTACGRVILAKEMELAGFRPLLVMLSMSTA